MNCLHIATLQSKNMSHSVPICRTNVLTLSNEHFHEDIFPQFHRFRIIFLATTDMPRIIADGNEKI